MEGYRVFEKLISPVEPQAFFEDYYEKSELFLTRGEPFHHERVLTLDDIDYVITELNPSASQIRIVDNALEEDIKSSDYLDSRGLADPRRVFQLFDAGATVILPGLNRLLPKLSDLCAALETVFTHPIQTNIYMTPPNAQGFKLHYDTHDVFIVQAAGTKDWAIYDPIIKLPMRGQHYDSTEHHVDDEEPRHIVRLECGDTAYIPRGLPHEARATSEISLHATVGVHSRTWADLMVDAVCDVCSRDPELRQSLPAGYADAAFDRQLAEKRFRLLLDQVVLQADFRTSFSAFVDDFLGSRRQSFRQQLSVMGAAGSIGLDECLRRRDLLVYSLEVESDDATIVLKTYGLEMRLPLIAEAALRHALSAPFFTPRGLPGELDDEGRLTLSRRLMREGLVVLA